MRNDDTFLFLCVSDFAIKCFQCSGSDVFCHHSKLLRNHTQDACNKYHDRCITKLFELDVGVREIMRGCGNREECEVAKDKCKRKAYPYNNCRVTCCEQDYCNSSNRVSGRLYDVVFILCSIFLSLELFLNWAWELIVTQAIDIGWEGDQGLCVCVSGCRSPAAGARFSKVPITFRARKAFLWAQGLP